MVLQEAETDAHPFREDDGYVNPHPNMSHLSAPFGNGEVAASSWCRRAAPISVNGSDIRTSGAVPSAPGLLLSPLCLCHLYVSAH